MSKLQVRVIPDSASAFRWVIADHDWDGISAPIAVSPDTFESDMAARTAGEDAIRRIESDPARDHPFGD